MLDCASQRLATEQLLCHMVRGGVLYDKQNIIPILIAWLMEYAIRTTTNLWINNPSQIDCCIHQHGSLQLHALKAVIMLVEHEESDQTSGFLTLSASSIN